MVIKPAELTQAGKLDAAKRLLGRVVDPEHIAGTRFSCYLACGPGTRDLLVVEAWRELASAAAETFVNQRIVSVTSATLSKRQPAKNKFTHSMRGLFLRFDRDTKAELEDHHGADAFPQSVPTTLLHRALCLKSGLVDVRVVVVDSLSRVVSGEKEGLVHQPGKARGEILAADVLA